MHREGGFLLLGRRFGVELVDLQPVHRALHIVKLHHIVADLVGVALLLHRVGGAVDGEVDALHVVPVQLQHLVGAQRVVAGVGNVIGVGVAVHRVDDGRIVHPHIAVVPLLAEGQGEAALLLILGGVRHREGHRRRIQAVVRQHRIVGRVGLVVGAVQVLQRRHEVLHLAGGKGLVAAVIVQIILVGVGVGQVLIGVVLHREGALPGGHDGIQRVVVGDGVLAHQVVPVGGDILLGVIVHQVDRAVPQGQVALFVHGGVVAHLQGGGAVRTGEGDGAGGIVQPVLAVVLHILNDEAGVDALEMVQEVTHLVLVDGEVGVRGILPGVVFLHEVERAAVLGPGNVGEGALGGGVDFFIHRGDGVDVLLHPRHDGDDGTEHHQNADQDDQFFLSIHTFFLLRTTSSTPSSRKQTGMMPIMQTLSQAADEELMVR